MDLLTFFASQPPETLVKGTQIEVTSRDGSVTVITLGERIPSKPTPFAIRVPAAFEE